MMLSDTVVVFDDDDMVAMTISETLLDAGWPDVRVATTVREALQALAEPVSPALAILDLRAPDGGGYAVAAAAVERGIPFLLMTGDMAAAEAAEREGFAVLRKPCASADIVAEAERVARRPEPTRAKGVRAALVRLNPRGRWVGMMMAGGGMAMASGAPA